MARIIIAGASGLVGSAVSEHLRKEGFDALSLKRGPHWNPSDGVLDPSFLPDGECYVNLCGEDISDTRWTTEKKKRIRESRIESTRLLSQRISEKHKPGTTLLNASAVGFYGDRGNSILTESSPRGAGFLSEVCQEWEKASEAAVRAGIRVILLRFGIVLSKNGGALAKMLSPFSYGLGGELGSGAQYMSWITLPDLVRAVAFCIQDTSIQGPVNICSPNPVTNSEFTASLASQLRRPAIARIPAFMLRLMLGEIADEGLLASQRAVPEKLTKSGFKFQHAAIEDGLYAALGY